MYAYRFRNLSGDLLHSDIVMSKRHVAEGDYVEAGPILQAVSPGGVFRVVEARGIGASSGADVDVDLLLAPVTTGELSTLPPDRVHRFYSAQEQ